MASMEGADCCAAAASELDPSSSLSSDQALHHTGMDSFWFLMADFCYSFEWKVEPSSVQSTAEKELQKAISLHRVEPGRKTEKCAYNDMKFSEAVWKMRKDGWKIGKLEVVAGTQRKEISVQKQNDSLENGKSFNRRLCNVRKSYIWKQFFWTDQNSLNLQSCHLQKGSMHCN